MSSPSDEQIEGGISNNKLHWTNVGVDAAAVVGSSASEKSESEDEDGEDIVKAHQLTDPLVLVDPNSNGPFHSRSGFVGCVRHFKAQDIPSNILSWIFDLMERNMKVMYEKSQDGWDFEDKKEEMTDRNSRYLIVFTDDSPVAFTHFQFDMDYGRQVLYCYEIQLEEKVRTCGLGKHLMTALELIAEKTSLQFVVLTVFRHNPKARAFFAKIGYIIDSTSPSKKEKQDYFILSKQIVAEKSSEKP